MIARIAMAIWFVLYATIYFGWIGFVNDLKALAVVALVAGIALALGK